MKIEFVSSGALANEITIRFLTAGDRTGLPAAVTRADFSGAAGSLLKLHERGLLCVGLGDAEKVSPRAIRTAAGAAVIALKKMDRKNALLDLGVYADFTAAAVEGALLAGYQFDKFKETKGTRIARLRIRVPKERLAESKRAGAEAAVIVGAANYARELANQPPNIIGPEALGREAIRLGREKGLRVTVLDGKTLKARGFGGLVAVGSGSRHEPSLIVFSHQGAPRSKETIALVGKAITFDTGGISIKPAANMESMVFDKCGGMAVFGAMAGIADLKLKRNVVGIVASAENMPGPDAYRPGDIITIYGGKTVEIINTDAEGRIVLADAITYARTDRKASAIVDIATLTGAVGVALGKQAAGLWSNADAVRDGLTAAAERTGERVWPMPLYEEYADQMKSDVAVLKNTGGRLGGACNAAAFLKEFAEDTPWGHVDIASMASTEKDRADLARGATGFGVRLLIDFAQNSPHFPNP